MDIIAKRPIIIMKIHSHIYPRRYLLWIHLIKEFCYGVYNQYKLFIYLDLIVKNRKISIEMYFKWWINIKLV
jgi:hypothetical protein